MWTEVQPEDRFDAGRPNGMVPYRLGYPVSVEFLPDYTLQIGQLEVIHTRHIIHRDIKPDNFIMGHEETRNRVFVVDFGMSKYYCNPKTRKHNKMITGKPFCGTARYASVNAHMGLGE